MNYCMVRNKYLTFLCAGLLFMASACNDGYEKEPVEQFILRDCAQLQAVCCPPCRWRPFPSGFDRPSV